MRITLDTRRLRPTQRVLFAPLDAVYAMYSYQSGKTTGAIAWALHSVLTNPGAIVWYACPTYTQARMCFRRMLALRPRSAASRTELWIELPGGGRVWFKSTHNPNSLYGESVDALVVDEASEVTPEARLALESRLDATGGPRRYIGNRRGTNWFTEWCDSGADNVHLLTGQQAVDAGIMRAELLEERRRTMPPLLFREGYELEAVSALNPFLGWQGLPDTLADGPAAAWGVDVAFAPDAYAICGVGEDGAVVHLEEWRGVPFAASAARVAELAGGAPVLVDVTGVGQPHCEQLRAAGVDASEYRFTQSSRQALLEGLAVRVAQGGTTLPEPARAQAARFTTAARVGGVRYESTAKSTIGDDSVMALALALWHLDHRPRFWLGAA